MKYTINGKQYSEFDINKRCAELMAWKSEPNVKNVTFENNCFWVESVGFHAFRIEDYCINPSDTWPIIEKCWDELMEISVISHTAYWDYLEKKHNCTMLVAACICFIEMAGN